MSLVRIVLDTNMLISAAIKPEGQQAASDLPGGVGGVELFASTEVLAEYREVFSRPSTI